MIIKDETLQSLRTMVKTEFAKHMAELEAKDIYKELATIITSTSVSNTYGWLGKFPQIREWIGPRVMESIKESSYAIKNKRYESTLSVERTDIEDDNLGIYPALSRAMADEVVAFYNRNIANLLDAGFNALCYDGQHFFDSEHPVYPKADGTGEASLVPNIFGNPSATGKPWFLLSLSGTLKPFILQQRLAPEMEEITDSKNYAVFMNDQFMYGIRWRGNFGFGLWQQAVASKEELTSENYKAARKQMQKFRRDGGDPLGIVPTHLVVGVENEDAARQILEAQIIGNTSNTNYHTAQLVVSQWLKGEAVIVSSEGEGGN